MICGKFKNLMQILIKVNRREEMIFHLIYLFRRI